MLVWVWNNLKKIKIKRIGKIRAQTNFNLDYRCISHTGEGQSDGSFGKNQSGRCWLELLRELQGVAFRRRL